MDFLTENIFMGNEIWRIVVLFSSIILGVLLGKFLQFYALRWCRNKWGAEHKLVGVAFEKIGRPLVFLFFSLGLKQGLDFIAMPENVSSASSIAMQVLLTVSVTYLFYNLIAVVDSWLQKLTSMTENTLDEMLAPMVRKSLRVVLIVLALVQIAQTLSDKPITSIIAGLGVGGLAVALAAQETLKNFFGSLIILSDKPFKIGDRIVVDGHDGMVQDVGFRSTRIRKLNGHLVVIPNAQMSNLSIENISARPFLRHVMTVTVTYDTPPEKVDRGIEIIKELLNNHEGLNPELPPRVYFDGFGSISLDILVIYWYHSDNTADLYWDYKTFNETFNRQLLRRFNDEGIEFAFPTQTLYLAGDKERALSIAIDRSNSAEKA